MPEPVFLDVDPHTWDFIQTRLPPPIPDSVAQIQTKEDADGILIEIARTFEDLFRLLLAIVMSGLIAAEQREDDARPSQIRELLLKVLEKKKKGFGDLAGELVRLCKLEQLCAPPVDRLATELTRPGPRAAEIKKLQAMMKSWPDVGDKLVGKKQTGTPAGLADYLSVFRNTFVHGGFSKVNKADRATAAWQILLCFLASLRFFDTTSLARAHASHIKGHARFELLRARPIHVVQRLPQDSGSMQIDSHQVWLVDLASEPSGLACKPPLPVDPLLTFVSHEVNGKPCPGCGGYALGALNSFGDSASQIVPQYFVWACRSTVQPSDLLDRTEFLIQFLRGEISRSELGDLPQYRWRAAQTYREALTMALADGVLEEEERRRLEELHQRLGISKETAHRIEKEVYSDQAVAEATRRHQHEEKERALHLFQDAVHLAWADGELSPEEEQELMGYARELGISPDAARRMIEKEAAAPDVAAKRAALRERHLSDSLQRNRALLLTSLAAILGRETRLPGRTAETGAGPGTLDLKQDIPGAEVISSIAECILQLGPGEAARQLAEEGRSLSKGGRFSEASPYLALALALDPRQEGLPGELGICLFRMQSYREALRWLGAALATDPANTVYLDYIAAANMQLGRHEAAEWFARRACDQHPTPNRWVRLARVRKRGSGGLRSAIETCRTGIAELSRDTLPDIGAQIGLLCTQLYSYLKEAGLDREAEKVANDYRALLGTEIEENPSSEIESKVDVQAARGEHGQKTNT